MFKNPFRRNQSRLIAESEAVLATPATMPTPWWLDHQNEAPRVTAELVKEAMDRHNRKRFCGCRSI